MTYVQKNIQNYVTKQQLSLGELAFLHQLSVKHLSSKRGVKYSILLTNNSGPAVQQIVFDSFSFTTCWCWLIYICKHTVFLYQADFFVVADSFTPLNKPSGEKMPSFMNYSHRAGSTQFNPSTCNNAYKNYYVCNVYNF